MKKTLIIVNTKAGVKDVLRDEHIGEGVQQEGGKEHQPLKMSGVERGV
eukprot:CAMPEP_0117451272 /NCGR_PEP_ID=MMETSP0759-20121206/8918_1 /TAXON_ID=63605 /ORGANISM="Percolomonas cosmopolitus, Strain WS" /LENGTH=47 /DNA_ID= /DNA_START= /DNA_END= /DNA_ORIENTATION=